MTDAETDSDMADEPIEPITSWDPLVDVVRQQVSKDDLNAVIASAWSPPTRRALWISKARTWLAAQPVTVAFWAFSVLALLGAIVVIVVGWPVWGAPPDNDYPEVVLAAASAVAFGSIVFSAVTATSTAGQDIAPGYTQVLLGRAGLWLTGLALIAASGLLFVFALFNPWRSGAIASALFAVSMVGLSWLSARRAIADSDPLDVARHASDHYRRVTRRARRNAVRFARAGLTRRARKIPEVVAAISRQHELDIVIGFTRQLRAGIDSTAGKDRLAEAVMLFEGVTAVFIDYALDTDGHVGRHDGLPMLLTTTADTVLDSAVKRRDSPASQYAIGKLVAAGSLQCRHPDFASVRTLLLSMLTSCIDRHWDDDHTTVAPDCVAALGELASAWLKTGALQDGMRAIDSLGTVATKSIIAPRTHIAIPAVGMLVRLVPVVASLERHGRMAALKQWGEAALPIAMLVPHDSLTGLASPTDSLMADVTLAQGQPPTLQRAIWRVPNEVEASADVVEVLLDLLERALPAYGNAEQTPGFVTAKGLSLLYAVALFAGNRLHGYAAHDVATRVMNLVTAWIADDAREAFTNVQATAPVWSTMLAAAFTARDPSLLASKAQEILDAIRPQDDWEHPGYDAGFIVSFYRGLLIAAGHDDEELAAFQAMVEEHARDEGLFACGEVADYGIGRSASRVPGMATMKVAAPPEVFEAVAAWAMEQWPRFMAPPDEERAPSEEG